MKSNINRKNILLLLFIEFMISFQVFRVIKTLYYENIGLTMISISILYIVYQFTKVVTEFPTGIIGDKYGRKISTILGIVFSTVFFSITAISTSMYFLVLAMFFSGVGYSFVSGSLDSLIIDNIIESMGTESLQHYSAIQRVLFFTAIGLSNVVGGYIANISYKLVVVVCIFTNIIALLALLGVKEIRDDCKDKSEEKYTIGKVFDYLSQNKNLYPYMGLTIGISALMIPVDTYMNSILYRFGLDEIQIGWSLFFIFFSSSLVGLYSKKVSIRFNEKKVLGLFPLLIIIMTLIFINSINAFVGIGIYFISMVIFSLYAPIRHKEYNKNILSKYRASILSFQSLCMAFVAIGTNFIFGYLTDLFGMRFAINTLGILAFILLLPCSYYFLALQSSNDNYSYEIDQNKY